MTNPFDTLIGGATPPFASHPDRACNSLGFDKFYPDDSAAARAVRQVCRSCVFVDECREFAIANHEYGVWGATTETERATIRRQRGLPTTGDARPRVSTLTVRREQMAALLRTKTAGEVAAIVGVSRRTVERFVQGRAA